MFLTFQREDGTIEFISLFDIPSAAGTPYQDKETLERVQLEKYRADYMIQFGTLPFDNVRRGDEPPDFVVTVHGAESNIDCAAVAIQERRQAEGLFSQLLKRLTADESHNWPNLRGCDVSISFGKSGELPPRKHDAVLDLVIDEALSSIVVDRDGMAEFAAHVTQSGNPSEWPPGLKVAQFENEHFRIEANPNPGWRPRTKLAERLGFTLSLQHQISVNEISTLVQRLVNGHDNEKTDHLLLSIGAPDVNGFRYPSEYVLATALEQFSIGPLKARYLSKITAHVWETGRVIELPVERTDQGS